LSDFHKRAAFLDNSSQIWEHSGRDGFGRSGGGTIRKTACRRTQALARFLDMAGAAAWKHFPEVKQSFPATDYAAATGTLVFNIAGNKFRLIARVDFEEQMLYIQAVMTHEKYNRENL
jgi:mRNA interferase HigB